MKLEDQVISLELAKKLKEIGVKQESLFCHTEKLYSIKKLDSPKDIISTKIEILFTRTIGYIPEKEILDFYSAFTVAELGEMLPSHRIITVRYKAKSCWRCKDLHRTAPIQQDWTEANARARMLIYLIENGLISHS